MTRLDNRLNTILSVRGSLPFHGETFATTFETLLNTHLLNLTGDPDRDIASITSGVETSVTPPMYEFEGFSSGGVRRLWCAFEELATGPRVYLVATKGAKEATYADFGRHGPEYGNSILVARLLDLAIEAAVAANAKSIANDPVDDRVRDRYKAMGFINGEMLDLNDSTSIEKALRFADDQYQGWLNKGGAFVDPW